MIIRTERIPNSGVDLTLREIPSEHLRYTVSLERGNTTIKQIGSFKEYSQAEKAMRDEVSRLSIQSNRTQLNESRSESVSHIQE